MLGEAEVFAALFQAGDHVVVATFEANYTSDFIVLDATVAEVEGRIVTSI